MRRIIPIALMVSLWCSSAMGAFYSGNEMVQFCHDEPLLLRLYVAGVFDQSQADLALVMSEIVPLVDVTIIRKLGRALQKFCIGPDVRLSQLSDVFCQYLDRYPQKRNEPANDLLVMSLSEAWPCA